MSRSLTFVCLLGGLACGPQNATVQVSPEGWRADLRELSYTLPRRHANAFHTVSKERFAAEVAALDTAIPRLSADQVLVGLMRLVALVGDGHTHVDLPPSWPRNPLELAWFGDELRVVAAPDSYRNAAGARVLEIGNLPVDSAMRLLTRLVPNGENGGRTRLTATLLLASPAVLRGAGVTGPGEAVSFELLTGAGERVSAKMSPVSPQQMSSLRIATDKPPIWLRRLGEPWWAEVLPDGPSVYLSFNSYPPEAEFRTRAEALGRLLTEAHARRLIIDLRRNGGGDFERFRALLLPVLRGHPAVDMYAITGPMTFSAAMVNALDLRSNVNAVLVGEPTGGRPNAYGEHGDFHLPNSGLRVSYSSRYYRFASDGDTAVMPDKHIETTWKDFLEGRDPVTQWILAQPIRR